MRRKVFDQSSPVHPVSESRGVPWAWRRSTHTCTHRNPCVIYWMLHQNSPTVELWWEKIEENLTRPLRNRPWILGGLIQNCLCILGGPIRNHLCILGGPIRNRLCIFEGLAGLLRAAPWESGSSPGSTQKALFFPPLLLRLTHSAPSELTSLKSNEVGTAKQFEIMVFSLSYSGQWQC